MEISNVKLRDGRTVQIRLFQPEDKEKLVAMYEALSMMLSAGVCRHTPEKDWKKGGLKTSRT